MSATYPLAWPQGWPRTPAAKREESKYRFKRSSGQFWTISDALAKLDDELVRLGATHMVLSSNYRRRLDGSPILNQGAPTDPGIAVYFRLKGLPKVMACDMHARAEENIRSVTLAVEAMRTLERHGGGVMMERAFEGFAALPSPNSAPWWQVLQVQASATKAEIEAAFRRLARERHPDHGGSDAMMAELNRARDQALQQRP